MASPLALHPLANPPQVCYMGNCAIPVIHVWCFMCITCVEHVYFICIGYTCNYICIHVTYLTLFCMCETCVLQVFYTCVKGVCITCIIHQKHQTCIICVSHLIHMWHISLCTTSSRPTFSMPRGGSHRLVAPMFWYLTGKVILNYASVAKKHQLCLCDVTYTYWHHKNYLHGDSILFSATSICRH